MTEEDRQAFKEARPYVVGVVALLFRMRSGGSVMNVERAIENTMDEAELFVREWESRYATKQD